MRCESKTELILFPRLRTTCVWVGHVVNGARTPSRAARSARAAARTARAQRGPASCTSQCCLQPALVPTLGPAACRPAGVLLSPGTGAQSRTDWGTQGPAVRGERGEAVRRGRESPRGPAAGRAGGWAAITRTARSQAWTPRMGRLLGPWGKGVGNRGDRPRKAVRSPE